MSRQYIDDHRIISRYLDGQLSDQERTEFEAYWAEHPELIDELEADARLESGFAHLQRSARLDTLIAADSPRRSTWPVLLAASLIAGVGLAVWLGAGTARPIVLADSAAALHQAHDGTSLPLRSVELLRARSTLYDAVIELPSTPTVLELHVLPEGIAPSAQYQISLLTIADDGKRAELGSVGNLRPEADGFLTVYVDSARLLAMRYELRIQSEAPGGSNRTVTFLLQVNPATTK